MAGMEKIIQAVYKDGVLRPEEQLPLQEMAMWADTSHLRNGLLPLSIPSHGTT